MNNAAQNTFFTAFNEVRFAVELVKANKSDRAAVLRAINHGLENAPIACRSIVDAGAVKEFGSDLVIMTGFLKSASQALVA